MSEANRAEQGTSAASRTAGLRSILFGFLPRTAWGVAIWLVLLAVLAVAFLPAGGCEWNPKSAAYDGVPRTREEVAALQAAEREKVTREAELKAIEAKTKALEAEAAARAETERLTREAEARTRAAQREYATALKRVAAQSESTKIELQSRLEEVNDSASDELASGLARIKVDGDAATAELNRTLRGLNAMRDQAIADSEARAKLAAAEIARKEEQQNLLVSIGQSVIGSAPVQAAAGTVPGGRSMLEIAALLLGGSAVTSVIKKRHADAAWDEAEKKAEAKAKEVKEAEDRGWDQASANNNLGSVLAALIPVLVKATNPNSGTVAAPPIVPVATTHATQETSAPTTHS